MNSIYKYKILVMNNNYNPNSNCEWNLPQRILALLRETLTKDKSESSFLGWTPVHIVLLMLSSIVVTISVHCFNQRIKFRKSNNAHNIHQSQPVYGNETFQPFGTFGRDSMDSSIEYKKPRYQYARNTDRNRTETQSFYQNSKKLDKSGSLRIIIKNK